MSIITIVYVPEGIAMSADSRLTKIGTTVKGDHYNYTISDNGQKIVLLSKVNVGISTCGDAMIQSKTIVDFLRNFEIAEVVNEDNIETISNKLNKYLKKLLVPTTVIFEVGGFKIDEFFVFEVRANCCIRLNYDLTSKSITYGVSWNGQQDAIDKLVNGKAPMNTNYYLMPLKDAIDLSRFLVDLTINYQRFGNNSTATCGGPIDTLVITKYGASFTKHKIYKP